MPHSLVCRHGRSNQPDQNCEAEASPPTCSFELKPEYEWCLTYQGQHSGKYTCYISTTRKPENRDFTPILVCTQGIPKYH